MSKSKRFYLLTLPKCYGVVKFDEPGAAAIAEKACIDIWGVRGTVTSARVEPIPSATPAKKRKTRR